MHIDCKFTRNNYLLRYDVLHTYFQSYQREEVLLYLVYCCASQAAFNEKSVEEGKRILCRRKQKGPDFPKPGLQNNVKF